MCLHDLSWDVGVLQDLIEQLGVLEERRIDCGEASQNDDSAPPATKVPVVPQERLACWVLALLQDSLQVTADDPNSWCPLSLNRLG